jgi:hypothetical protein
MTCSNWAKFALASGGDSQVTSFITIVIASSGGMDKAPVPSLTTAAWGVSLGAPTADL